MTVEVSSLVENNISALPDKSMYVPGDCDYKMIILKERISRWVGSSSSLWSHWQCSASHYWEVVRRNSYYDVILYFLPVWFEMWVSGQKNTGKAADRSCFLRNFSELWPTALATHWMRNLSGREKHWLWLCTLWADEMWLYIFWD